MAYAVKVIWNNGKEELVQLGCRNSQPAIFPSKRRAQEQADFLKMGISDEVQSINVVKYKAPKPARKAQ